MRNTIYQYWSNSKNAYNITNATGKPKVGRYIAPEYRSKWKNVVGEHTEFFHWAPDNVGLMIDRMMRPTILGYPAWGKHLVHFKLHYDFYHQKPAIRFRSSTLPTYVTYSYKKDGQPANDHL